MKKNIYQCLTGLALLAVMTPIYAMQVTLGATENLVIKDGTETAVNNVLGSELNTSGQGDVWLSLLKFDLSSVSGMTINSATFELNSNLNHDSGSYAHNVYSSSDDSWSELLTTGLNRPSDMTLSLLDSTNIDGTSKAYTWNVLSGVLGSDGLSGSNSLLSLLVRPDLINTTVGFGPHFNSRFESVGAPRLILDVSRGSIPEPSTWLIFATGLLGLAMRRRMW